MVLSPHAHETESSGISTSSDKDISPIGLGPSLMTSFNPNYPVKALSPKCCPFGGDTIQSITRRIVKHLLAHLEMHRLHACPFIRRSATAWHKHSGVMVWPWSSVHFTGAFCMEFPRRFSRIWGRLSMKPKTTGISCQKELDKPQLKLKNQQEKPSPQNHLINEVSLFLHLQWFHLTSVSQDYSSTDKQEQSACACWRQHSERTKMTLGP